MHRKHSAKPESALPVSYMCTSILPLTKCQQSAFVPYTSEHYNQDIMVLDAILRTCKRSSRQCPAIIRMEACPRSTSHYLDSSDPPGHWNTGDWCSGADRSYWRQIATAGCYGWTLYTM